MAVAMIIFASSTVAGAQANPPDEYELKAAFLFNFAKFIDWPSNSFASPQSSFTICFLGQGPLGTSSGQQTTGKDSWGSPSRGSTIKGQSRRSTLPNAFVSSSESPHLPEILESVQGTNVLLVGETNGFAASGGTIEFTLEDSHVRFTINTDAADRAGLKFSSKLLALARIVHNEGHSKGG